MSEEDYERDLIKLTNLCKVLPEECEMWYSNNKLFKCKVDKNIGFFVCVSDCCKNKEDYFIPSSLRDHWGLKKSINLWSDIVLNYNGEILSISQAERTRFKRSAKDHIAERFTEPRTKKRKNEDSDVIKAPKVHRIKTEKKKVEDDTNSIPYKPGSTITIFDSQIMKQYLRMQQIKLYNRKIEKEKATEERKRKSFNSILSC